MIFTVGVLDIVALRPVFLRECRGWTTYRHALDEAEARWPDRDRYHIDHCSVGREAFQALYIHYRKAVTP